METMRRLVPNNHVFRGYRYSTEEIARAKRREVQREKNLVVFLDASNRVPICRNGR